MPSGRGLAGGRKLELAGDLDEGLDVGFPEAMALDDLAELLDVVGAQRPGAFLAAELVDLHALGAVAQFVVDEGALLVGRAEAPLVVANQDDEVVPGLHGGLGAA